MPTRQPPPDNLAPHQQDAIDTLNTLQQELWDSPWQVAKTRESVKRTLKRYEEAKEGKPISENAESNSERITELMQVYDEHGIEKIVEIIANDPQDESPQAKSKRSFAKAVSKHLSGTGRNQKPSNNHAPSNSDEEASSSDSKKENPSSGSSKKKTSHDSSLFKRKESKDPKPKLKAPEPGSDWAKAIAIRIVAPIAIAGVISFFALGETEYVRFGVFVPAIAIAVWLVLHWYLKQWKDAQNSSMLFIKQWENAHNVGVYPIVRAVCHVRYLIMLYAFCVVFAYIVIGQQSGGAQAFDPLMILSDAWGVFVRTGLMQTAALFILVGIANSFYIYWSKGMEETEALWWLGAVVRIVRVFLYILALMGLLSALSLLGWIWYAIFEDGSMSTLAAASDTANIWAPRAMLMTQHFVEVGAAQIVLAMLVVSTLWKRIHAWCKSKREETDMNAGDSKTDGKNSKSSLSGVAPELIDEIGFVVRIIVLVILAVMLFFAVFSLVNAGEERLDLFGALWGALFKSSVGLPVAAVLLIAGTALNCVVGFWHKATERKHGALNSLGKFASYAMIAASAGFAVYAFVMAEMQTGYFSSLPETMTACVERASYSPWAEYIVELWRFAGVIAVAAVIIVIAVIYFAYDNAHSSDYVGGSYVYGGGYNPGGASSFGGGAISSAGGSFWRGNSTGGSFWGGGSSANTQVNDKYGRKIAEVDRSGIFSPTVVRDKHGAKMGTVHESSFGGRTKVSIGDDTYEVRDAFFGSDKVVMKDGKEVGRLDSDGTFRKHW